MAQRERARAPSLGGGIGLGWVIWQQDGRNTVWHDGGTGGHRSFVGFTPDTGAGAVILANAAFDEVDAMGAAVLGGTEPLPARSTVAVPAGSPHAALTGTYRLSPEFAIAVTSDGTTLHLQATAQQRFALTPLDRGRFKVEGVDAEIEFAYSAAGPVEALVLHQAGQAQRARKEGAPAREMVAVPEAVLESYVGTYRLAPEFTITISREGSQLFARATGQTALPIHPSSATRFYYEVVEAEIEFDAGKGAAPAPGLTLHQNGTHPAPRVEP
jgi:hypothetical protein